MKKMKPSILIVDDEKLIRYSLAQILSDEYITHEACNGKEALEIFRQNGSIDIVLTDIMMPVMDGIELIEKVRAENKDIIIIAITAVYLGKSITEVLEKGANQCLTKPFDIPQLMLILIKLIMKRKSANADLPIFS
ncbi:MAG: response regulator transcription factor [Planctomycetota bacterium]|jgi:CheY-like chemotaxis protein